MTSDHLRLLVLDAGTRLLGLVIGGLVVPLPPAATLATQLVLLFLTANLPGYCGTQLLSSPLTGQRTLLLAGALDRAALPVLVLQALAGSVPADDVAAALAGEHPQPHPTHVACPPCTGACSPPGKLPPC